MSLIDLVDLANKAKAERDNGTGVSAQAEFLRQLARRVCAVQSTTPVAYPAVRVTAPVAVVLQLLSDGTLNVHHDTVDDVLLRKETSVGHYAARLRALSPEAEADTEIKAAVDVVHPPHPGSIPGQSVP